MGARPWYKRYPADFIAGTLQMSLEEKGAYSVVLDMIYDRGGAIPDDAQWIARVCGCSTRKWNLLRKKLIELGKIQAGDGRLTNLRAEKELENSAKEARKLAESGAKGGNKTRENRAQLINDNDLAGKRPPDGLQHRAPVQIPDTRYQKERIYKFEGKVIRLSEEDFDRWRKSYHAIPDFPAELQSLDDYLRQNPPSGNWFPAASAMLRKKHERYLAERAKGGDPDYRPDADEQARIRQIKDEIAAAGGPFDEVGVEPVAEAAAEPEETEIPGFLRRAGPAGGAAR